MALRWYVIHAYSGSEKDVITHIKERILEQEEKHPGLKDKFGEILVPTEEVFQMREGKKRRSERKFFPGYVLINMEMDEVTYHLVKGIPKVMDFLGGDKAIPLSPKEVNDILNQVEKGEQAPKPKVLFEAGEVVRVVDGPFTDFNGVVEEVNYEKSRLRVAVMIFGRSTPVELEFSQVEKG